MSPNTIFTEPVVLSIITMVGTLLTTLMTLLLKRDNNNLKKDAAEIKREAVRREEKLDQVHTLVNGNMVRIKAELEQAEEEVRALRSQLRTSNEHPTTGPRDNDSPAE